MDVLMPQLGETVTEGTVANWHKQVGDRVEADEIILDVETDKVSMEIPSPGAGQLAKILVQAGETVSVGTVLAVVAVEGDAASAGAGAEEAGGRSGAEAQGNAMTAQAAQAAQATPAAPAASAADAPARSGAATSASSGAAAAVRNG